MGYKYGVWLVYDPKEFETTHVGHFTITCYMEKEDAYELYKVLKQEYGDMHYIDVDCNRPIIFEKNMYEDDDNNMNSWGYVGKSTRWDFFKSTVETHSSNTNYNFSPYPHTSIEYVIIGKKKLHPIQQINKCVLCKMELVDISSDDPTEWKVIT